MAKKQTIIKKPVGNGDISITIENNLKNTNSAPPPVKRRRRRKQLPTTDETNSMIENMLRGGGGGGVNLPPLKDVSYIKPPSNNFTVWRDNFNDSYNTTIPQGQAQQMGLLPLPKVEAPPPTQLALPAPPTADAPLTMREFAAIMMQQGKARPGYQNLHEDPYNDNEPMDDRYANLRPSSRIEEIEADVLKEAGATDEQIQNYQEQIKQQKASVSTTNQQKLEAAGIDPETIKNVKQIRAIKTAGTWQGKRNIKPNGDYTDDPDFIASYNAGRALWLSQQPEERETAINRNKKYTLLAEGEDPWDGSATGLNAALAPGYLGGDSEFITGRMIPWDNQDETPNYNDINSEFVTVRKKLRLGKKAIQAVEQQKQLKDEEDMKIIKEKLVSAGLKKDIRGDAGKTLSATLKALDARKQFDEIKRIANLDKDNLKKRELQEQAGKVITKAAQRYQANKEKKAWVKKAKEALEAEIDALGIKLQKERLPGSSQVPAKSSETRSVPTTSEKEKSERIKKAMESLKDFWLADTTKEALKQAKKDERQTKKKAQEEAEARIGVKSQALREKREQLEAQGKK
jgi:hypothetical protein